MKILSKYDSAHKLSPQDNLEFNKQHAGCPLNHHTTDDLDFSKQNTGCPLN